MSLRVRAQMPSDQTRPPRSRGWIVGVLGLLALFTNATHSMIEKSGHPNGYAGRSWNVAVNGPWPYPLAEVRTFLIIMGVDALLGIWLLQKRSKTTLSVRAMTFAAINFFGMAMMIPMMMHASQPVPAMLGWLLFSTCWSVAFAIGVGVVGVFLGPQR